jgi:hypothetical protein
VNTPPPAPEEEVPKFLRGEFYFAFFFLLAGFAVVAPYLSPLALGN